MRPLPDPSIIKNNPREIPYLIRSALWVFNDFARNGRDELPPHINDAQRQLNKICRMLAYIPFDKDELKHIEKTRMATLNNFQKIYDARGYKIA